jgi:hypothetical protein
MAGMRGMNQRRYPHTADDVGALGDTSDVAYPAGAAVYDTVGELLGTVSGQQDLAGYLGVHTGRLLRRDIAIPKSVIDRCDDISVYLRVRRDMLEITHRTAVGYATAASPMMLGDEPPSRAPSRRGRPTTEALEVSHNISPSLSICLFVIRASASHIDSNLRRTMQHVSRACTPPA